MKIALNYKKNKTKGVQIKVWVDQLEYPECEMNFLHADIM